jgi:hypothetical protein
MGGNNYGYGLSDSLRYYEIELDSLDASNSASVGAAATDFPLFLLGGKTPLAGIAAIKIIEVQIPFTWYVFNDQNTDNSSNNLARWTLTEFPSNTTYFPKVAVGNYTGGDALATALKNAINAQTGNHYNVTYSAQTQKFTFTTSKGGVTGFSFTFGLPTNSGNKNIRLYTGFPGGTTISTGTTLESPNVVLISGPNYLYVNSLAIGNLTNLYLPQGAVNLGGGNGGPQMAKIPVNCSSGETIFWQDPDPQKWFDIEGLTVLNQIDFFLTLGNLTTQIPLRLNGLGFSLKLGVLANETTHYSSSSQVFKRLRTD